MCIRVSSIPLPCVGCMITWAPEKRGDRRCLRRSFVFLALVQSLVVLLAVVTCMFTSHMHRTA